MPGRAQRGAGPGDGVTRGAEPVAEVTKIDPEHREEAHDALPYNPYKVNRGLMRAWHALKNSISGFHIAFVTESAFRQELTLAVILVPTGAVLPLPGIERLLLISSVLIVLIVELLNSSVEAAIDRISLERHELSRRAKDLGSAAVTVALTLCLLSWVILAGPLLLRALPWATALLHH